MKLTKQTIERFSNYVERYKAKHKFTSYVETLEVIIEQNIFDFITYSSIKNFLTKNLKEKLLVEYTARRCIKEEPRKQKTVF